MLASGALCLYQSVTLKNMMAWCSSCIAEVFNSSLHPSCSMAVMGSSTKSRRLLAFYAPSSRVDRFRSPTIVNSQSSYIYSLPELIIETIES